MPAHPVTGALVDKLVGATAVTEYVLEKPALRSQPGADPSVEFALVAHVFKHLDRYDAIEALFGIEDIHVAGDDRYVVQTTFYGLAR